MERYSTHLLALGTFAIILFSIWQGAHTVDPHHWGLMLSNAKDLYDGKIPYQEIFIQYGILTTFLQSLAYGVGQNMLSLIVFTAIMYAIGVLIVYAIALHTLQNKKVALYIFICLVFFHPLAIYPWSNYIAFTFLMAGLYFLISIDQKEVSFLKAISAGIFIGLAVLSREGLIVTAVLFLLISFSLDFVYRNHKKIVFINHLLITMGFLLPLAGFVAYLHSQNIFQYWSILFIYLPGIYIDESFSSMKQFFLKNLFQAIYTGYRYFDIRWILTSLVIFSCIWTITIFVFKTKIKITSKKYITVTLFVFILLCIAAQLLETFKISSRDQVWLTTSFVIFLSIVSFCTIYLSSNSSTNYFFDVEIVKIAFLSLLLLSGALHLSEIFRIATGAVIGIIVLFAYLGSCNLAKPFFVVMAIWLGITSIYGNRGNYFLPTLDGIINSDYQKSPKILSGQRWNAETVNYYQNVEKIFQAIQSLPCGIQYQKNNTKDSLLKVLSPFEQLQLAPFAVSDKMEALRPDRDASTFITRASKIVIFETIKTDREIDGNVAPKSFFVFAELPIPHQFFMPPNEMLAVLLPSECVHR